MTIPMQSDSPIELVDLVKDYGQLRAVNGVSLKLNRGEIFGLLGPNGAGKTSIISTLVTLEKPTSGTVKIFGLDVTKVPKLTKSLAGFVPQELIHHGYFDVNEILRFHSGYFGRLHNQNRIDYLLNRLSLWDHRHKKVKALSGGMKRRLLIAKALVHEPKLLLLDEPTAGVDIELREQLWEFVIELRKEGLSVLLTTHYIQEAEQLCDRVGILQKGQLKQVGETKSLIKNLTKRDITLCFRSSPGSAPKHADLIEASDKEWKFQVASVKSLGELIGELNINAQLLDDVMIREGSLEDVLKRVLKADASSGDGVSTLKPAERV